MPVALHRSAPKSAPIDARGVRQAAERMLCALKLEEAELSVLLTDDRGIRVLNAKHRHKDKPTDVLAFPMDAPGEIPRKTGRVRLLGDVVISIDTAARQAKKGKRPLLAELVHLLAHGLLHLVGYDHETDAEELAMNEMTERLVGAARGGRSGTRKPRADLAK